MPLDDYIAETMTLLQTQPTPSEIVVERCQRLRCAEWDGVYDDVYAAFNQVLTARLQAGRV